MSLSRVVIIIFSFHLDLLDNMVGSSSEFLAINKMYIVRHKIVKPLITQGVITCQVAVSKAQRPELDAFKLRRSVGGFLGSPMNEGVPMEMSSDVFDDAEEMCMNVAARDVILGPSDSVCVCVCV